MKETPSSGVRSRAACDECRSRKLKCTGERPTCARCAREDVSCSYSLQKQMGRPKKPRNSKAHGTPSVSAPRDTDDGTAASQPSIDLPDLGIVAPSYEEYDMDVNFAVEPETTSGTSAYGPPLTQEESLRPWMQPVSWPDFALDSVDESQLTTIGATEMLPALTPDTSSKSSPFILDPAIDIHHGDAGLMKHRTETTTTSHDPPHAMLPALVGPPATGDTCDTTVAPSCACLSSMYLTLESISMPDTSLAFPYSLTTIREAMHTTSTVLACPACPARFISAIQNVHLVGTVLVSIAERFGKILKQLNEEADRARTLGEQKSFRLADLSRVSSSGDTHHGGLGCAAAFSVQLSPDEWRVMCKKVVRVEVEGAGQKDDHNDQTPSAASGGAKPSGDVSLLGICRQMRQRQQTWHKMPCPQDFPRTALGMPVGRDHETDAVEDGKQEKEHFCMKMLVWAEKLVAEFDWS